MSEEGIPGRGWGGAAWRVPPTPTTTSWTCLLNDGATAEQGALSHASQDRGVSAFISKTVISFSRENSRYKELTWAIKFLPFSIPA